MQAAKGKAALRLFVACLCAARRQAVAIREIASGVRACFPKNRVGAYRTFCPPPRPENPPQPAEPHQGYTPADYDLASSDGQMNVTALIDTSGTVVERYSYDAYGKVSIFDASWTPRGSSSYDNEILYCGYRFDPQSQTYHVRNRQYHPTLGRMMQRDLIGYADGMNLYEYVGSKPVSRQDPLGLFSYTIDAACCCGIDAAISALSYPIPHLEQLLARPPLSLYEWQAELRWRKLGAAGFGFTGATAAAKKHPKCVVDAIDNMENVVFSSARLGMLGLGLFASGVRLVWNPLTGGRSDEAYEDFFTMWALQELAISKVTVGELQGIRSLCKAKFGRDGFGDPNRHAVWLKCSCRGQAPKSVAVVGPNNPMAPGYSGPVDLLLPKLPIRPNQ